MRRFRLAANSLDDGACNLFEFPHGVFEVNSCVAFLLHGAWFVEF